LEAAASLSAFRRGHGPAGIRRPTRSRP
jgi:hypothetical protein